jgi:alkylation response protein AidB-like acyl-CoA dehydrogenase
MSRMSVLEEQQDYRSTARAWLREHAPGPAAKLDADGLLRRARDFQAALYEAGYSGITWPTDAGGRGLGTAEAQIFSDEAAEFELPVGPFVIGMGMCGPTLVDLGTPEQKARYLPKLLSGEEIWCQLFSEPGAGSDVASLQAKAVRDDDGWVLNGQKVWTTNAQFASFGLLLARTDADVPKHKGLTLFIVPMDAEGVTVRGLRQISGEAEFNEVFFDDVRLEEDAVVGQVDDGWRTALTTLMFERLTIGLGTEGLGYKEGRFAKALADDAAARRHPEVRRRLGEIAADLIAVKFGGYRALTTLARGQIPGPEAGLAKVTLVNAAIAAGELLADTIGPDALEDGSEWSYMISFLPGLKSAGGTEEILRNTIGERVLGLPPEPRLDKGIPFSELRSREREAAGAAAA